VTTVDHTLVRGSEPHDCDTDGPVLERTCGRARSAKQVVAFYNQRGTCEWYIKEGKNAIEWTRLSCRTFAANAVRLQLQAPCAGLQPRRFHADDGDADAAQP